VTFSIPEPSLQVIFSKALGQLRKLLLQDALKTTVSRLEIPKLDAELACIVPSHSLAILASRGLRGELFFPVPMLLTVNPSLLGYYRLLYGYSQKEFYTRATGAGRLKALEMKGVLSAKNAALLDEFCREMAAAGALLLASLEDVNASILDDLTLLTLGPQLRGGANVKIGAAGIAAVFGAIREIVGASILSETSTTLELRNAAGRRVLIEFAADPDIIVRAEMTAGSFRLIVAIEVKGGRDYSNIHNRIGEAEKSHQKARAVGYVECWTIVNVDNIDIAMARRESPTTNRFYRVSDLVGANGDDYADFRNQLISLTGIAG
jgi:hypothetical protein